MHGIYKYEADGEVVYVGKTDSDFVSRIACHHRETGFACYLKRAKIFVRETKDARETDFLETVLINQYKPVLNKKKKDVTDVQVSANLDWVSWDEYCNKKKENRDKGAFTYYILKDNNKKLVAAAKKAGMSKSEFLDQLLTEILK